MDQTNEIVGKIIEGYKILKFLGKGKFSVVYQAERQTDFKLVALKIIKIYDIKDKNTVEKCLQEVNLLKRVNHPNIIKYLDSFIFQNELYIAVEWADKGDVKRLIKKYKFEGDEIDERRVIEYTKEIADGLNHMHEQRVIHRDLKPANILITSDGIFKLGDLGLGRIMNTETIKTFSKVGTPLYMAPEVINNGGYDFKCDNWSLGCVIYELITLRSPFQTSEKLSLIELFKKINSGMYPKIENNKYQTAAKLSEALLKVNPEERMDLPQVLTICNEYISKQEEKPRIDPFIIMDDIIEKLRLLNYEINFCEKHNHEIINKFYFAYNMYGYSFENKDNPTMETYPVQFAYFYDLCNWIMALIKQNANINILQEIDVKFKKYNKKKPQEPQIQDLINDLKSLDIKYLNNSRFKYGYGDGVCLVLTQLCDKYLIKQNFIFKKPKFRDIQEIEKIKDYPEDILLEENIGTNIGFKANTNYNNGFKSIGGGSKNKFFSGQKFKHFTCIGPMNDEISTSEYSAQADEEKNKNNNNPTSILYSNIVPEEWEKEFKNVLNLLEIPEVPEYMESQSESSMNNKDPTSESKYSAIRYLNNYSKITNNLDIFKQHLNLINNNVDEDLKKLNKIEGKLCVNNQIKEELNKLNLTKKATSHYKEEYDSIISNIKKMEKEKSDIEFKLKRIKKEEEKITGNSDGNKIKDMKKFIESILKEGQKLDEELSLLNTTILNKYNDDNIPKSFFKDEGNTIIRQNIDNNNEIENEDIFGQNEII